MPIILRDQMQIATIPNDQELININYVLIIND